MLPILVIMALLLAGVPAALLTVNLSLFRAPEPGTSHGHAPELSVLIPARNEADHIRAAMQSVLANQDVTLELIILNDQSTDATEDIVQTLAVKDSRITLINSSALPENWCGKQHACWQLAQHAHYDLMVFMDADVELAPQALARMADFLAINNCPQPALYAGELLFLIRFSGRKPRRIKYIRGISSFSNKLPVFCNGNPLASAVSWVCMNPAMRARAWGASSTSASINTIRS